MKQKLISFGISTTHWLEISFQDGGQINGHSLRLSELYDSTFFMYNREKQTRSVWMHNKGWKLKKKGKKKGKLDVNVFLAYTSKRSWI